MSRRVLLRPVLGLLAAALLGVVVAAPGAAYGGGPANWQIAFAGTGVAPGTGFGFGFWGWCELSGGVSSGNSGDCQVTQYSHTPFGDVHCQQNINISSWFVEPAAPPPGIPFPNFVLSGTSTTHPSSATSACPGIGGVPPSFADFVAGIPAVPGHYNLTSIFLPPGTVGEFQIQVTQVR